MVQEKQLVLNYWNINLNNLDLTLLRNVTEKEFFYLDTSLYTPIKKYFEIQDRAKVCFEYIEELDAWKIRVYDKNRKILGLHNFLKDNMQSIILDDSTCKQCKQYCTCLYIKESMDVSNYLCLCNDSRILDFAQLILHAVYDYTLFKYRLKLKTYNAKKSEYDIGLFNTSPLTENIENIVITYNKFPTLKDYLFAINDKNIYSAYRITMYDAILNVLRPLTPEEKDGRVIIDDLDIPQPTLDNILIKLSYNTLTLKEIEEVGCGQEEYEKLLKVNNYLDHTVPPSELVRILNCIYCKDEKDINLHNYEDNINAFNKHMIVDSNDDKYIKTNIVNEPQDVNEPIVAIVIEQETVEDNTIDNQIEEKLSKLSNGFSISEIERGFEIRYTYYDKTRNKDVSGKRTLRHVKYIEAIDILLDLQNGIQNGKCTNSKALSIYKTLNIFKDNIEKDYDVLLKDIDNEISEKDKRIEKLEKENKELRARLDSLLMTAYKEEHNNTEDEVVHVDELWNGELNHALREAAKFAIKQWDTIGNRRVVKVLKDYINKGVDSKYPSQVYKYLRKAFIDSDSFETRRVILKGLGLEIEQCGNNHCKIYPKNKKEYSFILSSTPGDHKSMINGIKKYIQMMFR